MNILITEAVIVNKTGILHWQVVAESWMPSKNRDCGLWTSWGGYPGKIPDDIAEWLDGDGNRGEYCTSNSEFIMEYSN